MLSSKAAKKQKNLLQVIFTAVFLVSFILIVFERIKISEQKIINEQNPKNSALNMVRGTSVKKNSDITEYNPIIKQALLGLNKNIDLLLSGKTGSIAESRSIYEALLRAQVPSIFQSMHIHILGLSQEILKAQKADLEYLRSKRSTLFEKYPYLKQAIQK